MKVNEQVYLIRNEFYVTPDVKRYMNIYLIVGKYCYLVDTGVSGSETLIEKFMNSINRDMSDLKAVFLTHSHPDHIGSATEIKRRTGCKIYAPLREITWIEDIEKQFSERPIPNFYHLVPEGVRVDYPLEDGETIILEDGIAIRALLTCGHSHGSMSYILNDELAFTGDAIPASDDLPIFVDYNEVMKSLAAIQKLPGIQFFCPAWDQVYHKEEANKVIDSSVIMLKGLKKAVLEVENELCNSTEEDKITEILKRTGFIKYKGNKLIAKSIQCITDK